MKQNWWKLLVVVVLVVAVGVALAAKNRGSDGTAIVATETTETPLPGESATADTGETPVSEELPVDTETQEQSAAETADKAPAKQEAPIKVAKADAAPPLAEPKKPAKPEPTPQAKPVATQLPKMIELGADKCIPCKMMQPIMDELRKEYKGKIEIEFIDVWKDSSAAEKWNIQSIPTQVFLDETGKEFFRHTGFFPKEDILKVFREQGINLE